MEIFPISAVFAVFLAVALRRGNASVFMYTIAMLPLGMASFANLTFLGNLALPLAQVGGASMIAIAVYNRYAVWVTYRKRFDTLGLLRTLNAEEVSLLLFSVYSIFSAIFLVRVFAGEIYVFPMRSDPGGMAVGPFLSRVSVLSPSSSNISQTFYIIIGVCFYFLCRSIVVRYGRALAHKAITYAAVINLLLGLFDFFNFYQVLSFFRTASYSLLDDHEISGLGRTIGGFPEASSFGTFSVAMGVYFLVYFIRKASACSGIICLSSFVFALTSLSTTAFVGLGFALILVVCGFFMQVLRNRIHTGAVYFLLCFSFFLLVIALLFVYSNVPSTVESVFYSLFISKAGSDSALERGAWASFAIRAFFDTYMLGAGVGSLRGNGWFSVYLGSVGIIGTSLLCFFYLRILLVERHGIKLRNMKRSDMDKVFAARAALLTILAMASVSATTTTLSLLPMLFCAISTIGKVEVADEVSYREALKESNYLRSFYS